MSFESPQKIKASGSQPAALSADEKPTDLKTARVCASALFILNGFGFGTFAAHLPVFRDKFGLNDPQLSIALFAMVLGALVSMPWMGKAFEKFGNTKLCILGASFTSASLLLIGVSPGFFFFSIAAFLYGMSKGVFDVSLNAQAVVIEKKFERPIMSSLQACWSIGGLLGACLSSLELRIGLPPENNLVIAALVIIGIGSKLFPKLIEEGNDEVKTEVEVLDLVSRKPFSLPATWLLKVAFLAFLALFCEGAMADWSAVFLKTSVKVSASAAATAYAAYSIAMAGGRLGGDWIINRWGPLKVLRFGGLITALGMLLALTTHTFLASWIGFLLVGFGLSNSIPIFYTASGSDPSMGAGRGIATVSTIGYLGFLIGPLLIGNLAGAVTLSNALIAVPVSGLLIVLLANWGVAKPSSQK